jgi:hypothetical protein
MTDEEKQPLIPSALLEGVWLFLTLMDTSSHDLNCLSAIFMFFGAGKMYRYLCVETRKFVYEAINDAKTFYGCVWTLICQSLITV